MNKTQWHFHPKIYVFIVSCYANIYITLDSSKIKRCFHYAACKQWKSFPRRSKRSQSRLRAFRACSNRSERVFTNVRDPALSELTNGYLTPLSARMSPNYFSNVPTIKCSQRTQRSGGGPFTSKTAKYTRAGKNRFESIRSGESNG